MKTREYCKSAANIKSSFALVTDRHGRAEGGDMCKTFIKNKIKIKAVDSVNMGIYPKSNCKYTKWDPIYRNRLAFSHDAEYNSAEYTAGTYTGTSYSELL